MKTGLEHLPLNKQDELKIIVQMIREKFDVEMIILFGSYARGDWVEELTPDGENYQYQSDFDVLAVADSKISKKHSKWDKLEDKIIESPEVKTPLTLISHSIGFFNNRLSTGHYFFTDIKKEGILLYDSKRYELKEARVLSPEEYREKATKYFNHWFNSAKSFFIDFQNGFNRKDYKIAAFQLHQSTERFYSALLLVLTDYKPKTHDIYTRQIGFGILFLFRTHLNPPRLPKSCTAGRS
ncbi:MAG: HEPN domain-containing protein [Ignavibacteria bacterium]|jgi:predicted nucleotidyltransferase